MRLSQKITGFLHNGVSTLWYFAVMAVKENFRNYVGRAGRTEGALSDELALLANGRHWRTNCRACWPERARAAIFWR